MSVSKADIHRVTPIVQNGLKPDLGCEDHQGPVWAVSTSSSTRGPYGGLLHQTTMNIA